MPYKKDVKKIAKELLLEAYVDLIMKYPSWSPDYFKGIIDMYEAMYEKLEKQGGSENEVHL